MLICSTYINYYLCIVATGNENIDNCYWIQNYLVSEVPHIFSSTALGVSYSKDMRIQSDRVREVIFSGEKIEIR